MSINVLNTPESVVSLVTPKLKITGNSGTPKLDLLTHFFEGLTTEEQSGDLVSFENTVGLPLPFIDVATEITAQQDLHGQANPYPAGGGKNKIGFTDGTYANGTNKSLTITNALLAIQATGTVASTVLVTAAAMSASALGNTYPAGTYMFTMFDYAYSLVGLLRANMRFEIKLADESTQLVAENEVFTATQSFTLNAIRNTETLNWTNGKYVNFRLMLVEGSTQPTAYAPYENICPITGFTGANVKRASYYNRLLATGHSKGDVLIEQNGIKLIYKGGGKYQLVGTCTGAFTSARIPVTSFTTQPTTASGRKVGFNNNKTANVAVYFYNGTTLLDNWGFTVINRTSLYNTLADKTITSFAVNVANGITVDVEFMVEFYDSNDLTAYPFSFGSTVYGGTLNVTTGVLTVTHAEEDLGTLNWGYSSADQRFYYNGLDYKRPSSATDVANAICDRYTVVKLGSLANNTICLYTNGYVYIKDLAYNDATALKTALSGSQLVYELATPTEVQLTPTQVKTLLGQNNVWSDCGEVDVTYLARA